MVAHLEPDILKCEIKWALGSITISNVSRGDGIPAELYQILKDNAVKVLHLTGQKTWKMQKTWKKKNRKRSVFYSNPKEEQFQRRI